MLQLDHHVGSLGGAGGRYNTPQGRPARACREESASGSRKGTPVGDDDMMRAHNNMTMDVNINCILYSTVYLYN